MNDFDEIDILLVEDSPTDAELTIQSLKRAGLLNRLFWVKDGVEALDFIRCTGQFEQRDRHHNLKVVLLDLKMPRLDGVGVLRELKADPSTHNIPIVVMTSSNQDRDIAETYDLHANGFVVKPVLFDEFSAAVAAIGQFWLDVNRAPTP